MPANYFGLLNEDEIVRIHHAALRVLHEVGVKVESEEILALLREFGGEVDSATDRVRFSSPWLERFILESDKYDWSQHRLSFECGCGIYWCFYLNPETDQLEPFTEKTFAEYIRLAKSLDEVSWVSILGLPFDPDGIPAAYAPLTEKLYAWKYGIHCDGTVQFTGLCPYIVEIYAQHAEETKTSLQDVFCASGYLISPLRLARPECEQMLYFHAQGLRMNIGHLPSIGGSTPVTLAGAAVLSLAESLFLSILQRCFWGGKRLRVGGSPAVMDMSRGIGLYGRPEQALVNSMLSQVARFYHISSGGGIASTDSCEPSSQAGMQKAMKAIAGLFASGSSCLDGGLLGTCSICSPEQLIYDIELTSAIRHMLHKVEVTDETCAVDEILEAGPGGSFFGSDMTARRFRSDIWEPHFWSRESLQNWLQTGAQSDKVKAKQRIHDILATNKDEHTISEKCEINIRATIRRAIATNAINSM